MLPASVTRAMSAQLDRVNTKAAAEADVAAWLRAIDPDRVIEALKSRNAALERQLARLQAQLDAQLPGGHTLGQRPVITAVNAARQTRLSLATVNRYLHSGFWQGEQGDDGRWFVFADQPLLPKERRKGG